MRTQFMNISKPVDERLSIKIPTLALQTDRVRRELWALPRKSSDTGHLRYWKSPRRQLCDTPQKALKPPEIPPWTSRSVFSTIRAAEARSLSPRLRSLASPSKGSLGWVISSTEQRDPVRKTLKFPKEKVVNSGMVVTRRLAQRPRQRSPRAASQPPPARIAAEHVNYKHRDFGNSGSLACKCAACIRHQTVQRVREKRAQLQTKQAEHVVACGKQLAARLDAAAHRKHATQISPLLQTHVVLAIATARFQRLVTDVLPDARRTRRQNRAAATLQRAFQRLVLLQRLKSAAVGELE